MSYANVLIVDDEPITRQTIAEWLKEKHFRVFEAESGRQAIEKMCNDTIDIVISDMVMPEMDGLQLLKNTRTAMIDAPFLVVTGFPSHSTAIKVMQAGASDYLAKPFSPEELLHRVHRVLMQKNLDKPNAPAKGIILGTAISAILWVLIIRAFSSLL